MRIGAAIMVFGMALSVHLNGQLTGDRPIKCGWGAHPELLRARIAAAPQMRPQRHKTYFSRDSAFAVHYDTTARGGEDHSPPLRPAQPDGTPDWVVEVGVALDSARSLLLALGFDPAPADDDSVYDVYLQEYNGDTYGEIFYPDGYDKNGRIISYLCMDNDFAEDEHYYTHGIDAARVTAAHEYFHAVQLGYGIRTEDTYFFEVSSVWFEDVAFPEVNDWVYWYDDFGDNPTRAFNALSYVGPPGKYGYAIAAFGHYLTDRYGVGVMPQIWGKMRTVDAVGNPAGVNAITATMESIATYGGSLTSAWTDFVARLFFSGVDTTHYFHPDQDWLTPPDAGEPQPLIGTQSQVFEDLKPGAAGIQALNLAGPTNLCLQIEVSPLEYAARLVLNLDRLALDNLTREPWYVTDLTSLSRPILVVGGESGNVEIMATAIDTLVPLDYALDFIAPNPVYPHGRLAHTSLTLGYRIAEALPQADHRIVIYNILGQELYRQQITRSVGEGSHKLHMSTQPFTTWPAGIYILSLTVDQRHTFTRTFTLLR